MIMENPISISTLNDFIFCPASIYFHKLYDGMENILFQSSYQLNGTKAHKSIDDKSYSVPGTIKSLEVYTSKYNLIGKIDVYNSKIKTLVERKKHVNQIYDGYVFQLYAQYFALTEMGYDVKKLQIHSLDDNKTHHIKLPAEDQDMFVKFEQLVSNIQEFKVEKFVQTNQNKCAKCIYSSFCDRGCV